MFITIVISCALGLLLGFYAPMIPYAYTKYTAIAIMAALDSIIGAINAALQKKYDMSIFVSGFFTNMFTAIAFTMLGVRGRVTSPIPILIMSAFGFAS